MKLVNLQFHTFSSVKGWVYVAVWVDGSLSSFVVHPTASQCHHHERCTDVCHSGTAPSAPQKTSHRTSKAKAKQEARNQDNTSSFYFCCKDNIVLYHLWKWEITPKISPKIIEGRWRWLPLCVSRCCPSRIIIITSCNQWVSANIICTSTRRTAAKPSYVRQAAVSHGSCPAQAL